MSVLCPCFWIVWVFCIFLGILISQAKTPSHQVNGILGGSVLFSVDPSPATMVKKIEWSFSAGTAEKIQVAEFNGQKWERPDPTDRFKQRLEIYNTSLRIQALELNDSGTYEARITRVPITQEDWTFSLTVYEPVPEPKIRSVSLSSTSEGCNVTLQCEVSGRENMTVSWRRGNPPQDRSYSEQYQLAPGGRPLSLSLQPSSPDSTFTCTASNPVSQRSVSFDLQSVCQIKGEGFIANTNVAFYHLIYCHPSGKNQENWRSVTSLVKDFTRILLPPPESRQPIPSCRNLC
uniref:Ig-like domain-containing protein n=1 Tax=Pelusios castaneus TaxID=367368 RepID=A0A8C8VPL5_9SAUR